MTQEKKVNGINVDQLFSTIELIKGNRISPNSSFAQGTNGSEGHIIAQQSKISSALYRKMIQESRLFLR